MSKQGRRVHVHTREENIAITFGILMLCTLFCFLLQRFSAMDTHVPLVFVLAVLFISRFTDGYFYGILASMIAVVGVNYVFTYPYFAFDFTITGYPLTFAAMLAVSCSVSALTTRIKEQEEIRLEAEKEKMRGNLLRAVSHDIRTPLTSIMGSASGLSENFDVLTKEEKLDLLDGIREEAQWLIRIVENLLSITRINGDAARIDKQDELVEEIISGAVGKFRKRFPDTEVAVELPEEVLMVPMDGILIEQVLVNLMENSVLHGHGTTKILIRAFRAGEKVWLSVEDDGLGIREDVLPRMFEGDLHSDEGQESDAKRNMGIGLSVCMSIVRAHRGNMQAENRREGGARVMFWLPTEEEAENGN